MSKKAITLNLLGDIFDDVYPAVKNWRPQKAYGKESGYRDDLLQFLRNHLNRTSPFGVPQQYSIMKESGRHLADIGIGRSVGIELKLNLKTKSEADRLNSQVQGFLRDYPSGVIIVLCGKTDNDKEEYLRSLLHEQLGRQTALIGLQKRIKIIKPSVGASVNKTQNNFGFNFPNIRL